ncbi:MAG: type II secretion system F family protein [Patescibacteria group bacterium]
MAQIFRKFWRGLLIRISIQDKINFSRHLSIVIRAGLPLLEGLKIIRRQTVSKPLLRAIDQVLIDISNGQFLATSLARYPEIFDDFFVNIVRVGEASGTLAANLAYVSEELRKQKELRSQVRSAMIYPIIIMIATIALISFLIFFAFPKILPLFASLKIPLPLPTKILIAVSSFVIANGIWILAGFVVFFICLRLLLLVPTVRYLTDKMLLYVPVLSGMTIAVNMANFSRVLSVLLKGGIKIVEATTITAQTFDNLVYRRELLEAAEDVKKGEQLAQYLWSKKRTFPTLLVGLIEIGENTGNLIENLSYLADYYREEVEMSLRNLTTVIEPILLLTMGMLVGFVAISVITPIYKITEGF